MFYTQHPLQAGHYSLRCYLPDDPLRVSIFLGALQESNWWNTLGDRILRICDGNDDVQGSRDDSFEWDSDYDEALVNSVADLSHVADNKNSYKLVFYVDFVRLEVSANNSADMCFLAFLEKLNELVGKDHLFKRSMLLIRAWWVYETPSYSGNDGRGNISDDAFCVLICAIFNR